MTSGLYLRVRFTVDDGVLSELHRLAFGGSVIASQPWAERLQRHSLTWVGAFDEDNLVGFVHLCWDGGAHAFVLNTMVHPGYQRRGIGRELVQAAAIEGLRAGCQWLHVDYEPHCSLSIGTPAGSGPPRRGCSTSPSPRRSDRLHWGRSHSAIRLRRLPRPLGRAAPCRDRRATAAVIAPAPQGFLCCDQPTEVAC